MTTRVLFVDDDHERLEAISAKLSNRFEVFTANGGPAALETLRSAGPFAAVVANLRMRPMNGIDFLAQAYQQAPTTLRLMLAGPTEPAAVLETINKAHVFRFLTKPCPEKILIEAINEARTLYRSLNAQQELLSQTLTGSVKTLVDILSLNNPIAFGRASRVRRIVGDLALRLKVSDTWELEIAALLYQIGLVTVPEAVWTKLRQQECLSPEEQKILRNHPQVACDLLKNIPRLKQVAEIVLCQSKQFDGQGFPDDGRRRDEIPFGSRLLRLASDFDALLTNGGCPQLAVEEIRHRKGVYDPDLVSALEEQVGVKPDLRLASLRLAEIPEYAIFAEDIATLAGEVLVAAGGEMTSAVRMKLHAHTATGELIDLFLIQTVAGQPASPEAPATQPPVDLLA
jgi:response regulator RpfG family c-di-GMP phosphodiesterase